MRFRTFRIGQCTSKLPETAKVDVSAHAVRLEEQITTLQNSLIEGEQSGEPRLFDFDAFKARKKAESKGKD